jgi:hypothetical protein
VTSTRHTVDPDIAFQLEHTAHLAAVRVGVVGADAAGAIVGGERLA